MLWSLAIRHAVLTGEFDVRDGLEWLRADRRDVWAARIDEAEANPPAYFHKNGWVVHAFQAAWSAISRTPVPQEMPARHLQLAPGRSPRGHGRTPLTCAGHGALD
ncbi:MAG: hypothetical protein WCF04_04295 [Candidatus Nanopelagicales bacterium]